MSKNAKALAGRPETLKGQVERVHGAGGRATAQLVEGIFASRLGNPWLAQGDDGAVLPPPTEGRLVMTTDAHVVAPLFFPGGDIGTLAVHGTINDLAVMGARPAWLSAAFILEEGLPLQDLARIVDSMAKAAAEAGVPVVTGDTKVVERGKADGVFITTAGVGVVPPGRRVSGSLARPGNAILVSGSIGDHGTAILVEREGFAFAGPIASDTAALHGLVEAMFASGARINAMRDPTRGGVASTLNEIARQSGVGMLLDECELPVKPAVAGACEFLGLDPLHAANEGKLLAICAAEDAGRLLEAMRAHPQGREAAIIGAVRAEAPGFVEMKTLLGGRRIVDWLEGDPLPRIC